MVESTFGLITMNACLYRAGFFNDDESLFGITMFGMYCAIENDYNWLIVVIFDVYLINIRSFIKNSSIFVWNLIVSCFVSN